MPLVARKRGTSVAAFVLQRWETAGPQPRSHQGAGTIPEQHHSVPDLLVGTVSFVHGSKACFTDIQVEALPSASQSLQTLCISEHVYSHTSPASFQAQIPSIAALSNLTKLHVTFRGQPDFGPLAQLTKIEDLALQCSGNSSDCSHIIHTDLAYRA